MPDKPTYIERLPAILAEARSPKPIPFFRRGDIEALFGLRRRQAINLMHRIGAIRVSREIAVGQQELVTWLERVAQSPDVAREAARRARVVDRIVELRWETAARARKIVLPDRAPVADLPEGVCLEPGRLTIAFDDEQHLLQRLFMLARLLASDPWILGRLKRK